MKVAEIQAGTQYLTYVSGVKVWVKVKYKVEGMRGGRKYTEFVVERADNGRPLSNRTAAALHSKEEERRNMNIAHGAFQGRGTI